jgi:hypothetical protein
MPLHAGAVWSVRCGRLNTGMDWSQIFPLIIGGGLTLVGAERRGLDAATLVEAAGALLDTATSVADGPRTISQDEMALTVVVSLIFGPREKLEAAKANTAPERVDRLARTRDPRDRPSLGTARPRLQRAGGRGRLRAGHSEESNEEPHSPVVAPTLALTPPHADSMG